VKIGGRAVKHLSVVEESMRLKSHTVVALFAVLSMTASAIAFAQAKPMFPFSRESPLNALKPLAQADPDDWQAVALLTRGCAESADTSCRDSGMAQMLDLHRRGITPPGVQEAVPPGFTCAIVFNLDPPLPDGISSIVRGNYAAIRGVALITQR
jgi:hypothetical protein